MPMISMGYYGIDIAGFLPVFKGKLAVFARGLDLVDFIGKFFG